MISVEPLDTKSTIASARPSLRAGDGDDLDGDRLRGEKAAGRVRVSRGDTKPGQILERLVGAVGRHCGGKATLSIPKQANLR